MEEHCKTCGNAFESIHGRKYCSEECRIEARRAKFRRFYNLHKEEYSEKSRNRSRIRREKLIAAGLCVYCGKNKPMEGKRLCFACALKRSQRYYENVEKELIQREQCAEQKAMEDHERENV